MLLRQLLLHNFWLKLFSLVLACLIWFVVRTDLQNARNVANDLFDDLEEVAITKVTVSVLASAEDPRRFAITPAAIEVRLRGRAADLRRLSPGEARVYVDLRGLKQPEVSEPVVVSLATPVAVIALRAIPPVVTVRELK
jgi:YbbR domain-containing protein